MNKLLTIGLFSFLLFFGCNNNLDNSVVVPTLNKADAVDNLAPPIGTICTWLYATKFVDGSIGDEFIYDTTFTSHDGREINVYARLKIPPGAFEGVTKFTMIPNIETLSIQLFPEMAFNLIVKLDMRLTGIDVKSHGYNSNRHVDFVYYDNFGGTEIIFNDLSKVNIDLDQIKVNGAKLEHFSRYGWVR